MFQVQTAFGYIAGSRGGVRIMVAKAKSLANTMLESSDCTKVIGARSMKRLQERYQCQIQHVVDQNKQQDDRWDAYISDLKPSWTITGVDQEVVKERRSKRAKSSEQGVLNCMCNSCMVL